MNKFFRFNVPVIYSDDIVLQRMSCMNCDDDDVVVIISHTGRTKSLVELAQLARENDAMVIALTSPARRWPGKPRWPLPWMCRKIPTSICRWSPVWPS
jgi:DNA-binding MurR/RpiR family transcriptional regulator